MKSIKISYLALCFAIAIFFVTGSCKKDGPKPADETVMDIDSNVYKTVKIGTQVWMAENLKVTRFNDGTKIPGISDVEDWSLLQTPARCKHDNENGNVDNLYNWYAVNTGKLAPKGWHVPSNKEFKTLENYLVVNGYNYDGSQTYNKLAKAFASNTIWSEETQTGAPGNTDYPEYRNKSGFNAIPSIYRSWDGFFQARGSCCKWWTSDEDLDLSGFAQNLNIDSDRDDVYSSSYKFTGGLSVRCIKD